MKFSKLFLETKTNELSAPYFGEVGCLQKVFYKHLSSEISQLAFSKNVNFTRRNDDMANLISKDTRLHVFINVLISSRPPFHT